MTNFNSLGQFISSFLNFNQNKPSGNTVVGGAQGAELQNVRLPDSAAKSILQNPAKMLPAYDFVQNRIELKALDGSEKPLFIKDLMNLPHEFFELVSELLSKNAKGLEGSILTGRLKALMQDNGKNALNDLVKFISGVSKQGVYQTEQLSEISRIINACIPGIDTNAAQMLKNLILLYLPWLPLGENINFTLEFANPEQEGFEESDEMICIYIQTLNFGLIKVILLIEEGKKVSMKITCPKEFPQADLQKNLKEETQNYNLETQVDFEHAALQKLDLKDRKPQINLSSSNQISPYLLMAAYSVIKTVIEIDKRSSLIETRQTRLPSND